MMRDVDAVQRGRVLVDAYGLDADDRAGIVPMAIVTTARTWHGIRCGTARPPRGRLGACMWADGIGDKIRPREHWLRVHQSQLATAVTVLQRRANELSRARYSNPDRTWPLRLQIQRGRVRGCRQQRWW